MEESVKEFGTGARRGGTVAGQVGDRYPRFDLVSHIGLRRLAETYGEGAEKRGQDNWKHGMSGRDLLNRSIGHIMQYLGGDRSEDHLAHAAWGLFAVCEQEELRPQFNDFWHPPIAETVAEGPVSSPAAEVESVLVAAGLRK